MTVQTSTTGIEFVRTPGERFADLPDFPWEPAYLTVDGLRMAYLDLRPEGGDGDNTDKEPILLLHGEPTWSYLYRRMIPTLLEAGHRVIAPDLIGFGRSDKPTDRAVYTYNGHVAWMQSFLDQLVDTTGLGPFVSFNQDWGGLIGLRVAAENPDRFSHLVVANTALPHGESLGPGFDFWLDLSQALDPFDCGALVDRTIGTRELTEAEKDAYRAPFPDESAMAGAREFPCLVAITPEHDAVTENIAAREVLATWPKPVLSLWGMSDPVLGSQRDDLLDLIPGTQGQPHQVFDDASHFIQDDVGAPLATAIVEWLSGLR